MVHLRFRRYAGCPFCHPHLRSIVQRHQELVAAGIRETVVFQVSSVHTAAAGTVAILALAFGPALTLALAGAALGGLVATTVFLLLLR